MTKWKVLQSIVGAVLGVAAPAMASCIKVEANAVLPAEAPKAAASLVVFSTAAPGKVVKKLSTKVIAGELPLLTDTEPKEVAQATKGQDRGKLRLMYAGADGKVLTDGAALEFVLEGDKPADVQRCEELRKAAELAEATKTPQATAVTADMKICSTLIAGTPLPRNESWLVVNSKGRLCGTSPVLRRGDRLQFGLALNTGEAVPEVEIDHEGCVLPTGAVVVDGDVSKFVKMSSKPGETATLKTTEPVLIRVALPIECASEEVTLKTKVQGTQVADQKVKFFERTIAVLHIGVLNSKLREPEFNLRASGGGNVITDREAEGRGPEYVAMVVVQGFPHYLRHGFAYLGRDRVHDHQPMDRTGLAFAFGLREPTKRFGVGLTYELVRGVNLVAMHEWVKRNRLDGVSLGDTFAGAAGDIPQTREWAKGWSAGITFDTAYLLSIFGK